MKFLAANGSVVAALAAAIVVLSTLLSSARNPSATSPHTLPGAKPIRQNDDATALEMDHVELLGNGRCDGLIESDDIGFLNIIRIIRQPGKPMHLVIQPIERGDIVSVERIDDDKRLELKQAIDQFRNRATIEAMRMDAVKLEPRAVDGIRFSHYQGRWFQLDSTANDAITRLVVVRAEQIFAAYRQIIAPRTHASAPPRLVVFASFRAYQTFLESLGVKIENQGCFLKEKNIVVIGSELTKASDSLSAALKRNASFRKQLDMLKKLLDQRLQAVADQYKKQGLTKAEAERAILAERSKFDKQLRAARDDLRKSDHDVAQLFKENMGQTFVRLYHESFHAYLQNYVFPSEKYDVPLWLNEGLAVIFQGGILDGNMLRVDAPNPEFLKIIRTDLSKDRALPLEKLLAAKESDFLATGATTPAEVNRYYAYAWGLAYNLVFGQQQLFNGPALGQYVQMPSKNMEPTARFEHLIGQPLGPFEAKWQAELHGR